MMVVQLRVVLTLPCNMSVPIRMQHNSLVALRQHNEVTIYWEIIRYQSQPDTRTAPSPSSNKHAHVR